MLALLDILLLLLYGRCVANADIAPIASVDIMHHATKDFTVGRGVLQLAGKDAVVYHFMNDGILQQRFVHVPTIADDQLKGVVPPSTKKLALAPITQLTQKGAGLA